MGNVTSTITLRLTDGLSGPAKAAAASIKGLGVAAKELEKLSKIDAFRATQKSFAEARTNFRTAQESVRNLARELANTENPSRKMQAAFRAAQREVKSAARAFEQQTAVMRGAKSSLEGVGLTLSRLSSQEAHLRTTVQQTTAALEQQASRAQSLRSRLVGSFKPGGVGVAAAGLAGVAAAHKATHFARESLETYREFDKERRFAKAVMGISDADQAPLVQQAIHMGGSTKFNDIQVLEAQRELAARGLKKDSIMGMMGPASNLGMALDLHLPDAVKQMEGAIFGFKKDISSLGAAVKSAQQTADYQVKAAKISGMTPEDLTQLYKYGATPARMAGISESALLGFGGTLKKANMGGDEAGVAFRALIATIQAPTAGAKTAMLANGLNYKNYQRTRDRLDVDPFVSDVAARYGVKLDAKSKAGLGQIFANKDLISDPAKFAPAVTALLRDTLGGSDAKSLKSIAGAASRYRDSSINSIDSVGMLKDLITKLAGNLPFANKLFGSKQGSRIATALADPETFNHMIEAIEKESGGYSEKIAGERMAGFDGAVSRFEGAIKNLETAFGRAWDNNGKGGALTWLTDKAGQLAQAFAEMNGATLRVVSALGAAGAAVVGLKGLGLLSSGFGLKTSAVALDASAAALTEAAVALGGAGALRKGGLGNNSGGPGGTKGSGAPGISRGLGLLAAGNLAYQAFNVPDVSTAEGKAQLAANWNGTDKLDKWLSDKFPPWFGGTKPGGPPDATLGSTGSFSGGSSSSWIPAAPRQTSRAGNVPSDMFGPIQEMHTKAGDAGKALGEAVRAGMAPELAGAVQDARRAVESILNVLTFSASPDISPKKVTTSREKFSALGGSSLHGSYADIGLNARG